jgi:hypothetical protein
MKKSDKGPVSQFLVEQLSELDTVPQYIQGHLNSIADAGSRYPLLGPKLLVPRGLVNSVQEVLVRLPDRLRASPVLHVHAGTYTSRVLRRGTGLGSLASNDLHHKASQGSLGQSLGGPLRTGPGAKP